jgi:hypothetical protein
MPPGPKAAKRCRLSGSYGRGDDWARTEDVLIDPSATLAGHFNPPVAVC